MNDTAELTFRDVAAAAPAPAATEKTNAITAGIANVQSEVAKFDQIAAGLRAIEAAHPKNVIVNAINTSTGMKIAEAGWRAYRNPRLEVERARKAAKQPVLQLGRAIDDFAGQLETSLRAGEDHYKAQIDAENERQEREREAKRQAEAARVAKHRASIEVVKQYAQQAQAPGMTAARITRGIVALSEMTFGPEFEEFVDEITRARDDTVLVLEDLHAKAVAREAEAARLEQQRQENERVAREQAERQRLLDEQAAELKRQADELAAQQKADAERRQAEARAMAAADVGAVAAPGQYPAPEQQTTQPAAHVPAAQDGVAENPIQSQAGISYLSPADAAVTDLAAEGGTSPVDAAGSANVTEQEIPTLSLSQIADRLGFVVTAKLLEGLGFTAHPVKAARLYRPSEFPAICDELIKHIKAARDA